MSKKHLKIVFERQVVELEFALQILPQNEEANEYELRAVNRGLRWTSELIEDPSEQYINNESY